MIYQVILKLFCFVILEFIMSWLNLTRLHRYQFPVLAMLSYMIFLNFQMYHELLY
jgi:hypothetical protein